MTELKDFVYELHRYADQTHTLKDKYEKLTDDEKEFVMSTAPEDIETPNQQHHPVFSWLENLQNQIDNS
ncbi:MULTISPECIES: hypothetical protein [Virgibacillus]|uniref:Uncharacterized protein n=2 Tax=Virgibacillus TaxID=84406 RepID=A0A024QDE3_9BACI|nr:MULTISPECIES: hypothetical protein [Virgibacillus]EQB36584.1 hypothetical protein M948_16250 [Virgibacillus sp. CM-4]MYL42416.1 hypothetical protein [Virgibacillus massiliensis]GGJ42678.1 hypothetical protein GCM10007111_01020 [Virgibacillus kapii]CDQ40282.1 hypothetical protein BN990_02602 [Virgibacillus massiliensis]